MAEVKEIGKVNFKYNGYVKTVYFYFNTFDNGVYINGEKGTIDYSASPYQTSIVLKEEPDYFEEDAEIIEYVNVPYEEGGFQSKSQELIFLIPSINIQIKTSYSKYPDGEGIIEDINFIQPLNIIGGQR